MNIYTDKVRVMRNTRTPGIKAMKEMIGQELDVKHIDLQNNNVAVCTKDKSDYWYFNLSDVRFLTPAKFKGNSIAIGDYVERLDGNKGIVTGFYEYGGENKIVLETKENGNWIVSEETITDHDMTIRTGTIEINGKKYNKEEVESKLSELKEIK